MHLSGNDSTRLCFRHDSRPLDLNDFSIPSTSPLALFWTFFFFVPATANCDFGGLRDEPGESPKSPKGQFSSGRPDNCVRLAKGYQVVANQKNASGAPIHDDCALGDDGRARSGSRADSVSIFDADEASDLTSTASYWIYGLPSHPAADCGTPGSGAEKSGRTRCPTRCWKS